MELGYSMWVTENYSDKFFLTFLQLRTCWLSYYSINCCILANSPKLTYSYSIKIFMSKCFHLWNCCWCCIWRPSSLSELSPIRFHMELIHLDFEASILCIYSQKRCVVLLELYKSKKCVCVQNDTLWIKNNTHILRT